jgi:hypothetical protein
LGEAHGASRNGPKSVPGRIRHFFIIGLALRLNPRYGREMDPQTAAVFKSERRQFIARYLQSLPLEIDDSLSWPFMSRQGYDQQRGFLEQFGLQPWLVWRRVIHGRHSAFSK